MSYNSTNTGAEIQEKLDKIVAATTLTDGLMSASDKTKLDNFSSYYQGGNSVTTLVSVPVTKRLVYASLSAATSLSLAATMSTDYPELYVVCTPTASFTQPIPNSGSWISMSGSSISVTSGVPFEISILYDGSYYRVTVKTQG